MAVPTIPSAISATAIQTEFGGSNPIALNEYYSGGTYVASGTANATSVTIPTSGQIAFSNFSGAASVLPAVIYSRNPDDFNFGKGSANAYARWETDGDVYVANYSNPTYDWINSGSSSDYDIMITRTGGSYSTLSGSFTNNTWRLMSTNGTAYLLSPALGGVRSYIANVQVSWAANNVPIDWNSYTWYAETEYTGCPLCCFTPNTPITMADGSHKLIVDVNVGDEIKTNNGNKKITEVVVRENMSVYRIMLNDTIELDATDDHPLYVRDKGWSCIKPLYAYKDIGVPHKLEIGDIVIGENGDYEITSMEQIWYPFKVYTFAETEFYANGILVY
jgi:hypothetical protein